MKREIKIGYLMHILLVLFVLLTLVSCTKTQKNIEETLTQNNIDFDKILVREHIDNRAMAFYQGKKDPRLKMGLFELRKDGWYFLIENIIDMDLTGSQQVSLETSDLENNFQGMQIPNYYLEYGVVHNPNIKTLKLLMTDESWTKEVDARIVNVNGTRIWYIIRNNKRIYNVIQGIADDGNKVFDSRPWFNQDLGKEL